MFNTEYDDDINPSGKIEATLGENNLLQIEWTPLSIDCIKFSSGVWIRVYDSSQKQPSTGENYLAIPQKCLKRRANATFSIALPSSTSKFSGKTCHFELKDVLIQCRVYTVEVVPNYHSLKGKPLFTEIVIPPAVKYFEIINTISATKIVIKLFFPCRTTTRQKAWNR